MPWHARTIKMNDLKKRALRICRLLDKSYPDAECSLVHESPLQLIVATILSAQCTDARVNIVTKELFKKYRTAADYAKAPIGELEKAVKSTGFYRNKAKSIQGMARMLVEKHGGEVPRTMEELLELPGVARKTANVVLGVAWKIAVGVVVDTHVHRISRRLGLTKEDDPKKIEPDLMELVPKEHWIRFSHQMIQHGRRICDARNPRCGECPLREECPSADRDRTAAGSGS